MQLKQSNICYTVNNITYTMGLFQLWRVNKIRLLPSFKIKYLQDFHEDSYHDLNIFSSSAGVCGMARLLFFVQVV